MIRITKKVAKAATRPLEEGGGWLSGGAFAVRTEILTEHDSLWAGNELPDSMIAVLDKTIDHVVRRDLDALESTPHLYEFQDWIMRKCGSKTWVRKLLWDLFDREGLYAWQESELAPIVFTEQSKKPMFKEDVVAVLMPVRPPTD